MKHENLLWKCFHHFYLYINAFASTGKCSYVIQESGGSRRKPLKETASGRKEQGQENEQKKLYLMINEDMVNKL